ncbi:MAG: PA0069 family radical SAM protein [Hyphomicrobiaceae bacterium]|nr:MAG: PA0069 family radical SAM protein [Hyphomicrobiaceae bacterium]
MHQPARVRAHYTADKVTASKANWRSLFLPCSSTWDLIGRNIKRTWQPEVADDSDLVDTGRRRGRGARSNRAGRFESELREVFDDGWETLGQLESFKTEVREEHARSIIARNDSPDISFEQSINPYRGCEHGCIYCFARPTHCYLGHSAGLDFETKLYAKVNAAELLERELGSPRYLPKFIALGAVTDPYQPIERERCITRSILEVLDRTSHPVGIVTKSALVVRDLDILSRMAARGLVKVAISVTTLDRMVARKMEPRAATPPKRLGAIAALAQAGVPVAVMVAPIIPALNDSEIEAILAEAKRAGATEAGYVLLRLPLELKELFREWLQTEFPDRAARIINILRSMHGGKDYTPDWGVRQRGRGAFAEQIGLRFRLAIKSLDLNRRTSRLRLDLFQRPVAKGGQMPLL